MDRRSDTTKADDDDTDSLIATPQEQRAFNLAQHAFDAFTAAVSIADVISDVVVAVQFFDGDHAVWGYLVVTSLLLASLLYTVAFVEVVREKERHLYGWITDLPRHVVYPLAFVFSQFLPSMNLLLTWMDERRSAQQATASKAAAPSPCGVGLSRAERETAEVVRSSVVVMGLLQGGMKRLVSAHIMFFVESAVEAVPQIFIQLLAISVLQQMTWAQVVSLTLSLLSVLSKAYLISHSFDLRVFAAKLVAVVFDVVSLFYVASTVLAPTTSVSASTLWSLVPGSSVAVLWPVAILGWKIALCGALSIAAFWGVFAIEIASREPRSTTICLSCMACLMTTPILLLLEGAKLSWLVECGRRMEPPPRFHQAAAVLFGFIVDHEDDQDDRVQHLYEFAVASFPTKRSDERRDKSTLLSFEARLFHLPPLPHPERMDDLRRIVPLGGLKLPNPVRQLLRTIQSRLSWQTYHQRSGRSVDFRAWIMVCIAAVPYFIGQLYSLCFPMLVLSVCGWHQQSYLQRTCLVIMGLAGVTLVILVGRVWTYASFAVGVAMDGLLIEGSLTSSWKVVSAFYTPPASVVLGASIPSTTIPNDVVVAHLSAFLSPRDVGSHDLRRTECTALRRAALRERAGLPEC